MSSIIKHFAEEPQKLASDFLNEILKEGVTKIHAEAFHAEVQAYINSTRQEQDPSSQKLVVRNSYHTSKLV